MTRMLIKKEDLNQSNPQSEKRETKRKHFEYFDVKIFGYSFINNNLINNNKRYIMKHVSA